MRLWIHRTPKLPENPYGQQTPEDKIRIHSGKTCMSCGGECVTVIFTCKDWCPKGRVLVREEREEA